MSAASLKRSERAPGELGGLGVGDLQGTKNSSVP